MTDFTEKEIEYIIIALDDFSKELYSRRHPLFLTINRLIVRIRKEQEASSDGTF